MNLTNGYFIYYLIELATFFGRESVMTQCKKLGYHLHLPIDIPFIKIADVAAM